MKQRNYITIKHIGLLLFLFIVTPLFLTGQTETFTSSTTWTAPAGVTSVAVECWGAGGGGGGGNVASLGSGGGGGGAYSYTAIIAVIPGNTYDVIVGLGGTLGSKSAGGTGGDSWFINATTILAKGGLGGGESQGSTPGGGGLAGSSASCIGEISFSGGDGAVGNSSSVGGGGGSSAGNAAIGITGATPAGATAPAGGGDGGDGGTNAIGIAGLAPGGGGGGGGGKNDGEVGGNGQVVLTYSLGSNCPSSTTIAPGGIQTICQGVVTSQLTATVNTSGGSGTPTILYQWYYSTTNSNNIGTATLIAGATSSTYTPLSTVSELGDRWYFCVAYATDNGCVQTNTTQSLASNAVQVTVNPIPSAPTITPDGSTTFCDGGSLTLSSSASSGSYLWSTLESTQDIVVTTSGTYNLTISENGCTSASSANTVVTVNPIPVTPTISPGGSTTFCDGGSVTLSSSSTAGSYLWSTTESTQDIVVTTSGDYSLTITENGCTSASSATTTVTVNTVLSAGAITGPTTVTAITGGLVYSITAVPGATNYTWTVPGSPGAWGAFTGQGTTSITAESGTQGGDIEVTVDNACGTGPPSTLTVSIGVAPDCPTSTAVAPTGVQTICEDVATNQLTATISSSGGSGTYAPLYQWYFNTTNSNTVIGATTVAGATAANYTPLSTVSEAGTRYYFCVGYATDNTCGQTDATQSLASTNTVEITVNPKPGIPTAIAGNANPAPSTVGLIYSTTSTNADANGYTWVLPTGWVQTGGGTSSSITVISGTDGQNGNITVTASNGCGISSVTTLAVTSSVASSPPTITLGTSPTVCRGTITANLTYSASTESPDQYSINYNLTAEGQGFTDIINASLPASPIVHVVPSGAVVGTYYATLTVRNSGTGLSSNNYAITVKVIDTPATPGTISGMTTVSPGWTGYVYSIASVSSATSYNWNVPSGWTITENAGTNITVTAGALGDDGDITVTAQNSCGTSAAASITISIVTPTDHSTINCNSCHVFHNATGVALTNSPGNSLLCQSCHVAGGFASTMPLVDSDRASDVGNRNSHSWNVLAVNPTYETNVPSNPEMLVRLSSGNIVCSTCHDQHGGNPLTSYLRVDNTGDAMCKDCHSARNVGLFADDNVNNRGSHPVGVAYDGSDSRFNAAPTILQLVGGNVECSSCHGVHDVTGATGLSTDGLLLRTNNDAALCTDCHAYATHNSMDCMDCHQAHNTNKANIYMIRDIIATPNSGNKAVVFTAELGTNSFADGNATYDGICEVCHTTTTHYMNDGLASDQSHTSQGGQDGANCTTCHPHSSNFSPSGGSCHNCHDASLPYEYPPTGAHAKHVGPPYNFKCSTCHFEYGSGGANEGTHPSSTTNIVFDPNSLAFRNGNDANTPVWNSGAKTCDNVYCHSNGITADRGGDVDFPSWGSMPYGTMTYVTTPSWASGTVICGSCHAGAGNITDPYTITNTVAGPVTGTGDIPATGSHQRGAHVSNSQNLSGDGWSHVQCFWCHNTTNGSDGSPNNQGTYGTSLHIDGQTHFKPRWVSNGGTMVNTITYSSEGSSTHCGAGKTCW